MLCFVGFTVRHIEWVLSFLLFYVALFCVENVYLFIILLMDVFYFREHECDEHEIQPGVEFRVGVDPRPTARFSEE